MRVKEILQNHKPSYPPITVKQIGPGTDYRPLLKEIKKSSSGRIIIDINKDRILDFFRQANEVEMLGEYLNYVILSLDTHTIDFKELQDIKSNITAIRIINSESEDLINFERDLKQCVKHKNKNFVVKLGHTPVNILT